MRRWFPSPVISILLFLVWLILNNSVSAGNLILAALLAWLIPLFTSRLQQSGPGLKSPHRIFVYLVVLLWDIVVANFQVALLILGPTKRLQPGFIKVPLDIEQALPVTILASTVSLTPGTVSADVLEQNGKKYLLIHTLNIKDENEVIETIKRRYEAALKEIFEC